MEDRRAHERLDMAETHIFDVKRVVDKHIKEHSKFEKALADNVLMTTKIADNTAEIIELFKILLAIAKGAGWVRSFVVWVTPIGVAVAALMLWIKGH